MKYTIQIEPNKLAVPGAPPVKLTFEASGDDVAKMMLQAALCQTSMNTVYSMTLFDEDDKVLRKVSGIFLGEK